MFQGTCCCLNAKSCPTLCHSMDCSLPGSCVPGDSPDKNPGVGCHSLLQGIFLTQGLDPGLLQADCLASEPLLFSRSSQFGEKESPNTQKHCRVLRSVGRTRVKCFTSSHLIHCLSKVYIVIQVEGQAGELPCSGASLVAQW